MSSFKIVGAIVLLATPALSQTPYISSFSGASTRNDTTAYVGMKITVGAAPISVTSLGRACWSGNGGSHLIVITNGTSAVASATVSMSSCTPGQFVYAAASATLSASTVYYVVSAELNGGDVWGADFSISVTTTAVATEGGSAYSLTVPPANPTGLTVNSAAPASYGPANFKYSTGGPLKSLMGVGK